MKRLFLKKQKTYQEEARLGVYAMLTYARRGLIIPTAMFVAMFALLISTLLLANVSYNVGLSLRSLEATEFRYLSLAASNELLCDLNSGLEREKFTQIKPRRTEYGGWVTESWVEPLSGDADNVFVTARTYRPGAQDLNETVRQLATYREKVLTRVYTKVTDTDKDTPDPIYFNDLKNSEAWSTLSAPPRVRYANDGTLETRPGESAGTIPFMAGAPDGSLYALYAPTLDGWDDSPSKVVFKLKGGLSLLDVVTGVVPLFEKIQGARLDLVTFPSIGVKLPWGNFAINTIVAGGRQGLTVGELAPTSQVLVEGAESVEVSRGALITKYSHDTDQWTPLPAPYEAVLVDGVFQEQPGNYHLQGIAGSPVAYDGGLMTPLFRNGADSIYRYTEKTEKWDVLTPPGKDVLLLGTDHSGNAYVQTGEIEPVDIGFLLDILTDNLTNIYSNTPTTALHQFKDEKWSPLPNPPAKFYDKSGKLTDKSYPSKGPSLSTIVGGKEGECFVVNRPPKGSGLVDTIYKYSDGAWEVVESPPNKQFNALGMESDRSGLPSKLEINTGSDGLLIVRVPNDGNGLDAIFVQDETDKSSYDILKPVQSSDGTYEEFFTQMAGGRRLRDNGLGAFYVRATYF